MRFTQYLTSLRFEFERYKKLGDVTFSQLSEPELYWQPHGDGNSVALIVKHMVGNMKSRWTNFLTEDGEKPWRHRETEFEQPPKTKKDIISLWREGWDCLFVAIDQVGEHNQDSVIKIRGEDHTLFQAFNRQLAHYAYHVGQIVLIGKMCKGDDWTSLSIPKGDSETFNQGMFGKNSS
ncbi:MAG: DUF1572 family protein [Flavobacteriaceae bacterium]